MYTTWLYAQWVLASGANSDFSYDGVEWGGFLSLHLGLCSTSCSSEGDLASMWDRESPFLLSTLCMSSWHQESSRLPNLCCTGIDTPCASLLHNSLIFGLVSHLYGGAIGSNFSGIVTMQLEQRSRPLQH